MERKTLFQKVLEFAQNGKGRRLLNTLNRKDFYLKPEDLDIILKVYREKGLPVEVENLKNRRGILSEDQYDILANEVFINCYKEKYDNFVSALSNLLKSGMSMNPTKNSIEP